MYSFKDFEKVRLKATYNIEIGDRTYQAGETIALFDKIQIAGLDENVSYITANGGFDNRSLIFWETSKELNLNFIQGVFSPAQFSLLLNARTFEISGAEGIEVTETEELESDQNRKITLAHNPSKDLFVYNQQTGAPAPYTREGQILTLETPFQEVIVTYMYIYVGNTTLYKIGQKFLNGYVELEGRTHLKDDVTGNVVTGIIKIPHLKLMSALSIRLGANAVPIVANFKAVGVPVGSRGNTYVSEFCCLSDDIDSDL